MGLELRSQQRITTSLPPEIMKLRSRHHLIAQMLAVGVRAEDVAVRTGYSVSRISILQMDPAFKELLASYQNQHENLVFDVKERLRQLSMESIDLIQDRIDSEPEGFSNKELFELAEMSLDRTGHGRSATVQHSFGLEPEAMELLKQNRVRPRVANLLEGELIEHISTEGASDTAPIQLELFPEEDKTTSGAGESPVYDGQAGDDPLGETELSAEVRAELSTKVLGAAEEENIVRFPARDRLRGAVD